MGVPQALPRLRLRHGRSYDLGRRQRHSRAGPASRRRDARHSGHGIPAPVIGQFHNAVTETAWQRERVTITGVVSLSKGRQMDRVDQYRLIVRRVIRDYAEGKPSRGEIQAEAIMDSEKDHYEVMNVGWNNQRRVHGSVCISTSSTARSGSSTTVQTALSPKS